MQAYSEGSCLRYPESIPPQREVTYEAALVMLLKAVSTAQNVPFSWSYVDKPSDGSVLLLYLPPNNPYPTDGIRWQDNEVKMTIPAGPRELEVCEIKYGFIPGIGESNASRVRRRYRLLKGGNPHLVLIHYTRGQSAMIPQQLLNQPIRAYPLRPINEPSVFVAGEKQGTKVFPPSSGGGGGGGGGGMGAGPSSMGMNMGMHPSAAVPAGGMPGGPGGTSGPMGPGVGGGMGVGGGGLPGGMPVPGGGGGGGGSGVGHHSIPGAGIGSSAGPNVGSGGPPQPTSSSSLSAPPGGPGGGGGMGLGMNLSNMSIHQQQALLAQQNNHMEALERRRERERAAAAAQQGVRHRGEEDDSADLSPPDEVDQISTRALSLARYKRNHDWMNEVFYYAAFGKMLELQTKSKSSPFSIFDKTEVEEKVASLQKDVEALQASSAQRRAEKIRAAQNQAAAAAAAVASISSTGSSGGEGIAVI